MAKTKLVERCVNSDLALVSSPEVVCGFRYDSNHRDEVSREPEKGAVSAQKALRGSEAETRELLGGTEENSVSPKRDH